MRVLRTFFEKYWFVSSYIDSVMLFNGIQQFDLHRDKLIETITNKYMQIRLFHETRKTNDAIKIRKKLRKIPHFRSE